MKILVTGGGGFLGQALCRGLIERGHEVLSFNRGDYPALAALGVGQIRGDLADARWDRRGDRFERRWDGWH